MVIFGKISCCCLGWHFGTLLGVFGTHNFYLFGSKPPNPSSQPLFGEIIENSWAEVFVLISIAYWVPWGPRNMSMLCLELNSHKHLWFSTLKKIAKAKFWEKKIQNPWLTFELLVKISWGHIHYSLRKVCTNWWNLDFIWLNFASSIPLYWFSVCMKLSQSVVFHDTVPTFFLLSYTKMFTCFFSLILS